MAPIVGGDQGRTSGPIIDSENDGCSSLSHNCPSSVRSVPQHQCQDLEDYVVQAPLSPVNQLVDTVLTFPKRALGNLVSIGKYRTVLNTYKSGHFVPKPHSEPQIRDPLKKNIDYSEEIPPNDKSHLKFPSMEADASLNVSSDHGSGSFPAILPIDTRSGDGNENLLDTDPIFPVSKDSSPLLPSIKYRTPLYHHPPNMLCFPQDPRSRIIYRRISWFGIVICSYLLLQVIFSSEFRSFYKSLQNGGLGKWSRNNVLGNSSGSAVGASNSPYLVIDQTGSSFDPVQPKTPNLVIAGKLLVDNMPCNLAQFDLNNRNWLLQERTQLTLYSGNGLGDVFSLLANHTKALISSEVVSHYSRLPDASQYSRLPDGGSKVPISVSGGSDVIVVGAFDTTYKSSQVTYCSVGRWDGEELSKVGEGLCNSALSKGMKITSAALAGPYDIYVAGSFQTRVWNGRIGQFINIYNVAHYNSKEQVWAPLEIGQLSCSWCTVTVLALAWDETRQQLHIAGKFNRIDEGNIPAGLSIYNAKTGHLVAHPGGGVSMKNATEDGVVTALQFDSDDDILYVMGSFDRLTATGEVCHGLAAWEAGNNRWTCLADSNHTVLPSSSGNMLFTPYGLFVAGRAGVLSTWPEYRRPYTVAVLKKTSLGNGSSKFEWSWLPGFGGHSAPIHCLSNGFNEYAGYVYIGGDNLVGMWSNMKRNGGLTPYGLFVAGRAGVLSTWPEYRRPYTVAVLKKNFARQWFVEV
mmetsp:Transcript_37947/g.88298  ORF Transcript_37947/g.88298 Transcript_37947/m.88298 type:complete len:744 (-) Transcript_37947:1509-3740(-)